MSIQKFLLTEREAAELLRTSPSTLERWRGVDGSGPPFVKVGRRVGYFPEAIRAWAESRTHTSTRRRLPAGRAAQPSAVVATREARS